MLCALGYVGLCALLERQGSSKPTTFGITGLQGIVDLWYGTFVVSSKR